MSAHHYERIYGEGAKHHPIAIRAAYEEVIFKNMYVRIYRRMYIAFLQFLCVVIAPTEHLEV